MLISVMIKEFSFFGRRKIIRWWENVETYIYLTIEIGISFFFFFLGWRLVGGKLVTNWFVIWKKWYYHKSCRSKSRPKVFFFSLALFRYLLTKSIVRSRTSFFSVIKLQRINNPFNLAPRLFVTHKPISSSSELGLIFTISYRFFFLITWNLD